MFGNLGKTGKYLGQAARMLIGIPDYDTYVQHMKDNHSDKPVMTYNEFFVKGRMHDMVAVAKAGFAAVNDYFGK